MTPQLDAGPVLVQKRLPIEPNETAGQLEPRLAALGADAVMEAIARLVAGDTTGIRQDPSQATKAPRLKKTDGLVDWSRSAEQIRNQIRAMDPWPKAYTFWRRDGGPPLRLILVSATALEGEAAGTPGEILIADAAIGRLVVACGTGSLAIERFQPSGKRSMSAGEFLRGHPLAVGQQLIREPDASAP